MFCGILVLKNIIKIYLLYNIICPVLCTGRKYDVETEAEKLYGEDFRSVLRRFRRTPDYLKILTDKMNELKIYVREMSLQVLHYYHGKMTQKVGDIVGVTRVYNEDTTTSVPPVYFHAFNARRQDPEDDPVNRQGIKQLDEYKVFNNALSVSERNSFKDLGFEFAGNLIHSIIHNMGPVDIPGKSTRLPYGGENQDKTTPTTTEHPHTHEVTFEPTATHSHDAEPEQTTETFRFRYRPHK